MKRLTIMMSLVVFAAFFVSSAQGENYVSKTYPSDEILLKALTIRTAPQRIIGKKRLSEDKYKVYYHDPDYNIVGSAEVVRLDNDIWIAIIHDTNLIGDVIHIIEK